MDYKIISKNVIQGKGVDEFVDICEKLVKEGWEPYGGLVMSSFTYEDGSGPRNLSQAFIKPPTSQIEDYIVARGSPMNEHVTLLLYKGWKLLGSPVSWTDKWGNCYHSQALVKHKPTPSLLD